MCSHLTAVGTTNSSSTDCHRGLSDYRTWTCFVTLFLVLVSVSLGVADRSSLDIGDEKGLVRTNTEFQTIYGAEGDRC